MPLHRAAQSANPSVVALLLDRGADIHARDGEDGAGSTPLQYAMILHPNPGKLAVVELLLDRGADIHTRDEEGWTPLLWAVAAEDRDLVELLLDRGADIHAQGYDGYTALHAGVQRGGIIDLTATLAILELLLERGLDAAIEDISGRRACHFASENPVLHGTDILDRLCP